MDKISVLIEIDTKAFKNRRHKQNLLFFIPIKKNKINFPTIKKPFINDLFIATTYPAIMLPLLKGILMSQMKLCLHVQTNVIHSPFFIACFYAICVSLVYFRHVFMLHMLSYYCTKLFSLSIYYVACDMRENYQKYLGKGQIFNNMKNSVWSLV